MPEPGEHANKEQKTGPAPGENRSPELPVESQPEDWVKNRVSWHGIGEAVIEFEIRVNAHAPDGVRLDDLRIQCEEPLYAEIGKDARKADVTVEKPDAIRIEGPIGEYLGKYSSIEHKSPTDGFTKKDLLRSYVYAALVAEKNCERDGMDPNILEDLTTVIVCSSRPEKVGLFREFE